MSDLEVFDVSSMRRAHGEQRHAHSDAAAQAVAKSRSNYGGLDLDWSDAAPLQPSAAYFGWQGHAKRAVDIIGAGLALLFLAPLLALAALAIAIESRGPVLFRQEREGKFNTPFTVLKFRSMHVDRGDSSGVAQTLVNDDRVTKVGKFLRRTSIDELPQLFNVLRGDMSLVGPRPHVAGMLAGGVEYRELVGHYDLRLLVAPGLTGWAQANSLRGPTTDANLARRRVDYDLAYIQNFSLALDIKIIFKTIANELFTGTGH